MRHYILLFFFVSTLAWGQVTTDPAFPTADAPVTIIYDATKGTGGVKDVAQVYMHSGVILDSPTGTTWLNTVGNWGKADGIGAMTKDGTNPNIWRITLTPRTYFNIAAGTSIYRMGMVFREAGPCSSPLPNCKEGKSTSNQDIFVDLFSSGLQVNFTAPLDSFLLVEPNSTILVQATASKTGTLKLFNGTQLLTQVDNGTALGYGLVVGASGSGTVKIQAIAGSETKEDSFQFLIKTPTVTAAAPAGTKDGINYKSATSVVLQLYAPQKQIIYALGDFNNWTPSDAAQMKRTPDGNRYWIELTGLTSGQEYGFQYLIDGSIRTGDPYCDKVLDPQDKSIPVLNYPSPKAYPTGKTTGTVSVFQTNQQPYNWTVPTFQRPTADKLVIYEVLVRDFLGTKWYKHLGDTLSYLKRLGINTIELMPVQEFAGNDSWGYNPTYYFAPDKAYGTKNDLKAFIDKCHQNGIAVVVDMVFNHADYEFPYVKMYWDGTKPTATSPYFNPQATHPFSVFYDFNHESVATQALVDTINRYWLREYRIDGFRFDLSKGFTQKNTGNDVGAWSAKDDSRIALLKRMYDRIRAVDPSAYVILEHLGVNEEEKILAEYGMMLWGNMQPNYKEMALGYKETGFDYHRGANLSWTSYKQRGWTAPRAIPYMESHDEERLMYEQLQYGNVSGTYNTKDLVTALDRMKMATVLYFSIPGPKMIWQFGELGYDISINEKGRTAPKPPLWNYYQDANRKKLFKVYAEILKLRALQTVFHTDDFSLSVDNNVVKTIQLNSLNQKVFVVANTGVTKATETLTFQQGGTWYDYFTGTNVEVATDGTKSFPLEPGEFHIFTTQRLPLPEAGLVPTWGGVTGLEDEALNRATTIYPNPSTNLMQVTIQNDVRAKMHLKLTDLQGRVLQQVSATKVGHLWQYSWDMSSYAAGMYMLEITDGKGRITKRVLKQ